MLALLQYNESEVYSSSLFLNKEEAKLQFAKLKEEFAKEEGNTFEELGEDHFTWCSWDSLECQYVKLVDLGPSLREYFKVNL